MVPQRLVLDAAVAPEGDRVGLPAKPDLKFLPRARGYCAIWKPRFEPCKACSTRIRLLRLMCQGANKLVHPRSQLRLADHLPAQTPSELMPCHVPEPEFPLNRPVPLAL